MKHKEQHLTVRLCGALMLLCALAAALIVTSAPPARAQCFTCNGCEFSYANITGQQVSQEHIQTREHFGTHDTLPEGTGELGEHQAFLINYLFLGVDNIGGILPALMLMTQQMTSVMMQQMLIVGSFLDAKHQLETQQLFQEMTARAHKAYQPSVGMCIIGTNTRSLARAERYSRLTSHVLNQHSLRRQSGSLNTNSAESMEQDRSGRLNEYVNFFCDRFDNNHIIGVANSGLTIMCPAVPAAAVRVEVNGDADYTRMVELPRTIGIDFPHLPGGQFAERTIFSLADNLFSHDVLPRMDAPEAMFTANHDDIQDMRSIIAKRSVAMNTFSNIVGLKAFGSPAEDGEGSSNDTSQYMRVLLNELGVPEAEHVYLIGNHNSAGGAINAVRDMRPSYFAQMEMLTKRLFQNPEFFTSLYDTPANVKRKGAALQAMGMMLQRDIYDSYIRNEMLMSMLLEIRLERAQRDAVADSRVMSDY